MIPYTFSSSTEEMDYLQFARYMGLAETIWDVVGSGLGLKGAQAAPYTEQESNSSIKPRKDSTKAVGYLCISSRGWCGDGR